MGIINVMIVENDAGRLAKLSSELGEYDDLRVVSAVTKRETAIKQLSLAPDVIVMNPDVLKDRTLARFLASLQSKLPTARVVLIRDELPEDPVLIEEIKLGSKGYLKNSDSAEWIAKAIRAVAWGEIWAERRVLEQTIVRHLLPSSLSSRIPDVEHLTAREMDMLNRVLQGSTNREIAEQSNISERTVKTHLYRVYRKLKVKSRAKAIALLSHSG